MRGNDVQEFFGDTVGYTTLRACSTGASGLLQVINLESCAMHAVFAATIFVNRLLPTGSMGRAVFWWRMWATVAFLWLGLMLASPASAASVTFGFANVQSDAPSATDTVGGHTLTLTPSSDSVSVRPLSDYVSTSNMSGNVFVHYCPVKYRTNSIGYRW